MVIAANPELSVCALSSRSQPLDELAVEHAGHHVQVGGDPTELLEASKPDLVLNAVVGFAGVGATLWALEHGVTLALANKESLVAAGDLAIAAREAGRRSACCRWTASTPRSSSVSRAARRRPSTRSSSLPPAARSDASPASSSNYVTVEEVLNHPTWKMGPKVTIDSATLLNKGLEVIEAHLLFRFPYEAIGVVVHPQSIVHSLVRLRDGAALAHLGYPTCTCRSRSPSRFPIANRSRCARSTSRPG